MTENFDELTPSPEAANEDQQNGVHGADEDRATDESDSDSRLGDEANWPEPLWQRPEFFEGWVFQVDPPLGEVEALRAALNAPGLVLLGFHPHDMEISSNWLRKLFPERIEDETHLFLELDLDPDAYPVVNESDLFSEMCRLHAEKVSEAGVGSGDLPMVAVVACGSFAPSPAEREQNLKRLERRGITLVLTLGSDELARFTHQNVQAFDLDTIDVAFRHIVKTLEREERYEELDPCLEALYSGLSVSQETLTSIRSKVKQRNDLREALESKLREAASDAGLALDLCQKAIAQVTIQADASASAILQSLGLANEPSPAGKLDLDELAESSSVQEPFATAVFLLWAWHGVRPDGVNENEFKSLFQEHLKVMAAEEQRAAEELVADAKKAGLKRKYALENHKTPATRLLASPELIDRVLEKVGAQIVSRNGDRHVGYARQTQDVLRSQIARVPTYVKDQIGRLEQWLNPISSTEQALIELGRFLFVHTAERNGLIDKPACRRAVVRQLVYWVEVFDDPRLNLDRDEAEFEKFLKQHEEMIPSPILWAVRRSKLGPRNRRLRQKIVTLIGHWYKASLESAADDGASITKDFTTLVTDLLRELLHRNKPVAFIRLIELFLKNRPELLNVQSLFRIAAGREQAPFIGQMIAGTVKDVEGFEKDSFRIGRLGAQASAYRYIVSELSDEARLSERIPRERWAISSLALRVLPGVIQRLQQADYDTAEDSEFSSDALMAIILGSESGIEDFVDTMMNDRVRLYPAETLNLVPILASERGEADEDIIRDLLVRDLCLAEFHCRTIWFRIAQHLETTPATLDKTATLEDVEDDKKAETDEFVARTNSEIRTDWWDNHFRGTAPAQLAEYQSFTTLFAYSILQEFHGMLLCSGRAEQASRLLKRMHEKLPKEERGMLREVVRTKTRQLAGHRRALMAYRGSLLRQGNDLREVDLWLSFAETRTNVIFEFK